jgi:hypothetical protein
MNWPMGIAGGFSLKYCPGPLHLCISNHDRITLVARIFVHPHVGTSADMLGVSHSGPSFAFVLS